ncbi:amidohydrolase family protein [Candidatus Palauibacter sp.]|uniref:amidohydrolase family protein n=1 Tax=Candidatus Palauibacter sp. TaxID=3101350 RepID=UPI003B5B98EE
MKTIARAIRSALTALSALILLSTAAEALQAGQMVGGPDRGPEEGNGPYDRLIIRGATVIDGTGAPPIGPMDIVIEGNRIVDIVGVGVPHRPISEERRPGLTVEGNPDATVYEIDASGMYVLPGFVDLHLHTGGVPKAPEAEYTYKLWMSHGITTGRGVGFGPYDWTIEEKARSAANETVAPRMWAYPFTGAGGEGWDRRIDTPEDARAWVRYVKETGGDGLKLGAHRPEIMEALLDEAAQLGLGSTAHLNQMGVAQMNAIDAARIGLGTVTHFYGLFESLYKDHDVQPWPPEMNYNDEQHRFGQVPMQWNLIHERGSPEWNAFLEELLSYDVTLDPTMTAYQASWDVDDQMYAPWHENYTLPTLWEFYEANREDHGSYYFDWTTWEEVAWRDFLEVWHDLLNDYKNMGGRVTASSDAGYIYNLMGFSTIQEMELLQHAGFHPLEVIRAATMHAAETLFKPTGRPIEFGVVRAGLLADLVIVEENPIRNLKVLYGTGARRLNDETGEVDTVGGILYTIKDGIVYDAKQLLADVAEMVEEQKRARTTATDNEDR